jgi:hypothetical protein
MQGARKGIEFWRGRVAGASHRPVRAADSLRTRLQWPLYTRAAWRTPPSLGFSGGPQTAHTHTHNAAGTSVAGFRGIPTCPANDPSVGDPARLSHTRAMWDPRGAPVEVASGLLLGRSSPAGPDAERRCETANSTQHPTPMADDDEAGGSQTVADASRPPRLLAPPVIS